MIAVLVLGGIIGPMVVHARTQRAAVQTIHSLGGHVGYDWECMEQPDGTWRAPCLEPSRLRKLIIRYLGPDAFCNVVKAHFGSEWDSSIKSAAPDDEGRFERFLAAIAPLGSLRSLDVYERGMNTESLRHLEGLTRLTHLRIWNVYDGKPHVEGSGLHYLKDMNQLRDLDLTGVEFADESLADLKHVGQVRKLALRGLSISDEGMKTIAKMPNLRALTLSEVLVTNEGLNTLRGSQIDELEIDLHRFIPVPIYVLKYASRDIASFCREPSWKSLRFAIGMWRSMLRHYAFYGYFHESGINDETFDRLAENGSLRIVKFEHSDLNEDRLKRLLASKRLEEIGYTFPSSPTPTLPPAPLSQLLPPSVQLTYFERPRRSRYSCGERPYVRSNFLAGVYFERQARRRDAALKANTPEESNVQQ